MKLLVWLRAMRLQTLPVAMSSMIVATALIQRYVSATPGAEMNVYATTLCFIFAVLAQITSNFANEYYDYVRGGDKAGREGFRRGVAEGDISARAMKIASIVTIAIACAVGLCLVPIGGWQLIPLGIVIALGAFAYSAGPYPLSQHGLGEVAVIIFFGIVPICATFYLSTFTVTEEVFRVSLAMGFLAANVLVVNNYRDYEEDRASNKTTLAIVFGRKRYGVLYMINGLLAMLLFIGIAPVWLALLFICLHSGAYALMMRSEGRELNKVLVVTSLLMLGFAIIFCV